MHKYTTTTVAANVRNLGTSEDFVRRTFQVEVDADFEASEMGRINAASRQIAAQGFEIRDIEFVESL